MGEQPDIQPLPPSPPQPGIFKTIFHHPNFNAICGFVTIISLVVAIYFGLDSIKEPDLTYYVSPTRTPILQAGQLDDFSMTYHGIDVTGNLSSAEIQIWNAGRLPIKKEDIRTKQMSLHLSNNIPIYKVTVTTSRDVIGFNFLGNSNPNSTPYTHRRIYLQANGNPDSNGVFSNSPTIAAPYQTNDAPAFYHNQQVPALLFDWDTLEQNDAIKLQIIYGGRVNEPIFLDGVIMGQKQGLITFTPNNSKHSISDIVTPTVMMGLIGILWIIDISNSRKNGRRRSKALLFLTIAYSMATLFNIWRFIYTLPKPPFGF